MHLVGLGERQTLSDKASESLAQGVVPPFNMCGEAGFFACRGVLRGGDDQPVGFPEITKAVRCAIGDGDALPQLLAGGGTSITDTVSDDLTGCTTKSNPNPAFVGFLTHK